MPEAQADSAPGTGGGLFDRSVLESFASRWRSGLPATEVRRFGDGAAEERDRRAARAAEQQRVSQRLADDIADA